MNIPNVDQYNLLDYVPVGAFILKKDMTVLFWNRCLELWTGVDHGEIIGSTISSFFPDIEDTGFSTRISGVFTNGPPVIFSSQIHRQIIKCTLPDGRPRIQKATVTAVPGKNLSECHALIVIQDVSDLTYTNDKYKQVQTELIASRNIANDAARSKSEFLANMSHEIRTPLSAIIGMTNLTLETNLNSEQNDYIGKVNTSAKYLLAIINDILDFSKIEAGKLDIEESSFNLDDVFNRVFDFIHLDIKKKNLDYILNISDDVPRILVGDSLRLGQILTNFAGNAVKFTNEGKITITVEQEEIEDNKIILKFSIRDSGIGMTQEQRAKIFQSFNQADTSTTRRHGGTGLGLSINKNLINLMNGTIQVESAPGAGSTFIFTAQFKRGQKDQLSTLNNQVTLNSFEQNRLHQIAGAKILLVEDNEINQLIGTKLLEKYGMVVHLAVNGQEAVEVVINERFDLVLMDIQMPVLDGYEATRILRERPGLETLPIIAMTAHAMKSNIAKSHEAGMNDHMTKPIDSAELIKMLTKWIPAKNIPTTHQ